MAHDRGQASNIIAYVRGASEDFHSRPFGEVDSLVLSQLAYWQWERILEQSESRSLTDCLQPALRSPLLQLVFTPQQNLMLWEALQQSPRFAPVRVLHTAARLDEQEEKQFAAVTFLLPDQSAYVAFRGTDANLVGWKEDFNMTYTCPVPSQQEAVHYLHESLNLLERHPLRLGGHSKGGNLAIYAAAQTGSSVKSRITAIHSHDAPGFHRFFVQDEPYRTIRSRIHHTVPQSSLIGLLLQHSEDYRIVQSRQLGLLQHDPFSWQISDGDFIYRPSLTAAAERRARAMNDWLNALSTDQRARFVEILYGIVRKTGARTLFDLSRSWWQQTATMIAALQEIDEETRRFLKMTFLLLLSTATRMYWGKGRPSRHIPDLSSQQTKRSVDMDSGHTDD